jgi:hypothetical protein
MNSDPAVAVTTMLESGADCDDPGEGVAINPGIFNECGDVSSN